MVVLDFGNTNIKIINNDQMHFIPNTKNEHSLENLANKLRELKIKEVMIVNVTTDKQMISELLPKIKIHFFDNETVRKFVVFKEYDLSSFGNDRIANIYSYKNFNFYEDNFIIFDFGTFVTLDIITNNVYEGGQICLGPRKQIPFMDMSVSGFEISGRKVVKRLDRTNSQINDGLTSLYSSWVESIGKQYPNHQIIITGHDLDFLKVRNVQIIENLLRYLTKNA